MDRPNYSSRVRGNTGIFRNARNQITCLPFALFFSNMWEFAKKRQTQDRRHRRERKRPHAESEPGKATETTPDWSAVLGGLLQHRDTDRTHDLKGNRKSGQLVENPGFSS